ATLPNVEQRGSFHHCRAGDVQRRRLSVRQGACGEVVMEKDDAVPLAPEGRPPTKSRVPLAMQVQRDSLRPPTVAEGRHLGGHTKPREGVRVAKIRNLLPCRWVERGAHQRETTPPPREIRVCEWLGMISELLDQLGDGVFGRLRKVGNAADVTREIESARALRHRNEGGGEPFALRRAGIPGENPP